MQHSHSSEANQFSASQEIPHILRDPKVHYCIHKFPPTISILREINPVHVSPSHVLKIHLNIILPAKPGFPSGLFPSGFPTKTLYTCFLPIHATCPTHLILRNLITQIISGEEYRSFSCLVHSYI